MPFIAKRKGTDERIDITTLERPREVLKPGECVCQVCGAEMIIKAGTIRQHHFAHAATCPSDYQSHPESFAHREAKKFLVTRLSEQFQDYAGTQIEYEVPIREVMRIADLLVTFPTGWKVAHEVQLASINYRSAPMTMPWQELKLFGGWAKAQTPPPIALGVEKPSDTLSYSIWPNERALSIEITAFASEQQVHTPYREKTEYLLPPSWFRQQFAKRWTYARQMRADPRLLALIRLFTTRVRRPLSFQNEPCSTTLTSERRQMRQGARSVPSSHQLSPLEQQVATNPVVQEAIRLFGATITKVETIQPAPLLGSSPKDATSFPQPNVISSDVPTQSNSLLDLQEDDDIAAPERTLDLRTRLRRRELEKEALRRQVQKLGGKPCA